MAAQSLPSPVTQFQIVCIARWMAKKAIKEKLWRSHVKLSSIPARDITLAAHSYLDTHPELYAQAKALAEQINSSKKPRGKRVANSNDQKPPFHAGF